MTQLPLVPPTVADHRVRALAGVIAAFRWPDRGSLQALTKPQREAAEAAARLALEHVEPVA